ASSLAGRLAGHWPPLSVEDPRRDGAGRFCFGDAPFGEGAEVRRLGNRLTVRPLGAVRRLLGLGKVGNDPPSAKMHCSQGWSAVLVAADWLLENRRPRQQWKRRIARQRWNVSPPG